MCFVWCAESSVSPYNATSHTGGVSGMLTEMSCLTVPHFTPLVVCGMLTEMSCFTVPHLTLVVCLAC